MTDTTQQQQQEQQQQGDALTPEQIAAAAEAEAAAKVAADKTAKDAADTAKQAADDAAKQAAADAEWAEVAFGDDTADAVVATLKKTGISVQDAETLLLEGLKDGDITKIDKQALIDKIGKAEAELVYTGVNSFLTAQKAKGDAIIAELDTVFGGEVNRKTVTEWAAKNMPDQQRLELAELIDAGGEKAAYAAQRLLHAYNADDKNSSLGGVQLDPEYQGKDSIEPLSRRQYFEQLEKAQKTGKLTEQLKGKLWQARQRGQAKGM